MDNLTVGRNISRFRKLKDIKAYDMAERLQMKEAAYTKYERGETAITIDFVNKVAEALEIDPLQILAASPSNFFENFSNSAIAITGNSTLHTANEQQTQAMVKMMEHVVSLNERMVQLMEKSSKGL